MPHFPASRKPRNLRPKARRHREIAIADKYFAKEQLCRIVSKSQLQKLDELLNNPATAEKVLELANIDTIRQSTAFAGKNTKKLEQEEKEKMEELGLTFYK